MVFARTCVDFCRNLLALSAPPASEGKGQIVYRLAPLEPAGRQDGGLVRIPGGGSSGTGRGFHS